MDLTRLSEQQQNEGYEKSIGQIATTTALTAGGLYAATKYIGDVRLEGINLGGKRLGRVELDNLKYIKQYTVGTQPYFERFLFKKAGGQALRTGKDAATVSEVVWEAIKTAEEQLFKIPRVFSGSALWGEQVFRHQVVDFSEGMLRGQGEYLKEISKGMVTDSMLKDGLQYREGKIYARGASGQFDHLVLNRARVTPGQWNEALKGSKTAGRGASYTNRIVKSHYAIHGMHAPEQPFVITGGSNLARSMTERFDALFTTGIQNYMKILDNPFEMVIDRMEGMADTLPGLRKALGKGSSVWETLGMKNILGVGGWENLEQRGSKLLLRHLSRGLPLLGLGFLAYKTIDELVQKVPGSKHTIFSGGLKGAAGKLYQQGGLAKSKLSDVTGLTKFKDWQEKKAPGSTSLLGLAAIPASMAIAAGTIGAIHNQVDIRKGLLAVGEKAASPKWFTGAIDTLSSKTSNQSLIEFGERFKKMGRTGAYAAAAFVAGAALVLPFIPGAIGSDKSNEELHKIYSGEQKVEVRRGRWWEMGSCISHDSRIYLDMLNFKLAEDIQIGDFVLGKNGTPVQVIEKWERHHKGKILKFTSVIDRTQPVCLTDNHIVPIIKYKYSRCNTKKYSLAPVEINAGEIKRLDYVQIPVPQLPNTKTLSINTADFITDGKIIVENERIFASQTNCYTRKEQKTSSKSLPETITISEGIGRLFGYYLAEGNLSFNGEKPHYIETVHAKSEKFIVDDIVSICETEFGITPKIKFRTDHKKAKEGCWIVRICSTLLARLFYSLFYDSKLEQDKKFPELFFSFDVNILNNIVEGYWRGDGHDNSTNVNNTECKAKQLRKTIRSTRYDLVKAVQKILLSQYQLSTITKSDHAYNLSWNIDDNINSTGFIIHEGYIYTSIIKIEEEDYDDKVYDFCVDDEYHLLQAGDFLVHNSPIGGDEIDRFKTHWSVEAATDARHKALYPEEYYNKPFKRALNRMLDPYYLERALDKERPYTYWGQTDHGFGLMEKLGSPLKEVFKPTVLAHPEALGYDHPARDKRKRINTPESLMGTVTGINTTGYLPEAETPSGTKHFLRDVSDSVTDTLGIQGFAFKSIKDKFMGNRGALKSEAVWDTSGNILSMRRAYWDQDLGGMAGSTEWYRRLNPDRNYETEYVSSPLRNAMPEWLPKRFQYGDPFAQVKQGETRLPGRGYAAMNPELEGVDPNNYSAAHRLSILADVAPGSTEFNKYKHVVEEQIQSGEATGKEQAMYNEILRQQDTVRNKNIVFDEGKGIMGNYWLGLKKAGRALPTEALYPLAPVHKFSGPVDVMGEYKSQVLLDKRYKLWENPIRDYLKPAFNRTMDAVTLGHYTPGDTQDFYDIEDYFSKVQYAKNKMLEGRAREASQSGDRELASYYRRGIQRGLGDLSPFEDAFTIKDKAPQRLQRFIPAMAQLEGSDREDALRMLPSSLQRAMRGQYLQNDLVNQGNFEALEEIKRSAAPIGGEESIDEMISQELVPNREWTGYAPGVNLNAPKVKVVNSLGKSLRDHGLWREDERQARIYDAMLSAHGFQSDSMMGFNPQSQAQAMTDYLRSIGMRDARLMVTPSFGGNSFNFDGKANNQNEIRKRMKEEGYISTL